MLYYNFFFGQVAKAAGAKHSHSLACTASSVTAVTTGLSRMTGTSNAVVVSSKSWTTTQGQIHMNFWKKMNMRNTRQHYLAPSRCLWMAQRICFCCPVHCQRFLRQQQAQFWRWLSKFCKGCFGVVCISLLWCLDCQGWWGKDSL